MEPQKQATCESAIQLGDLTINAKGGKYVPLRRNGGPPVWQSAEWQKIIWHPAAFNDPTAKRVGLCLEPDEASTAQLWEIEQHLVRALTARSLSEPKVFGKFLTETDVKDRFQVSFFEYLEKIELYCSKENYNLKACRLKLFLCFAAVRFNCLEALTGSTFNGQEPNRRRSTAACKMLCRAHWRCIGCFQTRAACRGLALLLLGDSVLRSAKQACVQPSESRAHEASAGLYVPSTQLDNSQSNCLIGVNHHRHDVQSLSSATVRRRWLNLHMTILRLFRCRP